MEKLVVIDCCIREESRTKALLEHALAGLNGQYLVETISLVESPLTPLTRSEYAKRASGDIDPLDIEYATKIRDANRIIIAAPLWDMSFPSILKVFFERVSIFGITFLENEDGSTRGNSKCTRLLYITSRGMDIKTGSKLDQGSSYIQAISWLFGIQRVDVVSMKGMDIKPYGVEKKIAKAKAELDDLLKDF